MKAKVLSYTKDMMYLMISDVKSPGEICIVQTSSGGGVYSVSGQLPIAGSMALTVPWGIGSLAGDGNELKILYRSGNYSELVSIDSKALISTLQPLQAEIAKDIPDSIRSIAACTICYNEDFIIKKWAHHYGKMLGYENLYIIDDGSDIPVAQILEELPVNITRVPRTTFDSWRLVRTLGLMQRMLLETYDLVITSDSDEFIVSNDANSSLDLVTYLKSKNPKDMLNVAPVGYDLLHSRSLEENLDADYPILSQRKYVQRSTGFDKPVISSVPTSFMPGLHNSYFPKKVDANLLLLHVRTFDYKFAVEKLNRYKSTAWSEHDLKTGLAFHQRQKLDELDSYFKTIDDMISNIDLTKNLCDLDNQEVSVLDENIKSKFSI